MSKRKLVIGLGVIFFILMIGTSLVLANTENTISNFFKSKQDKLEMIKTDNLVVEAKNFKISYKDYIDYKENLSFIHEINKEAFHLSPEEILQQMIEFQLILQEAEKSGVVISDAEVREYALQTKTLVEESADSNIQKIELESAKALGVNSSELYTHPDVLKHYEEILTFMQFVDKLYDDEQLNDDYTYEKYVSDLLKENESTIKIYENVLLEQ